MKKRILLVTLIGILLVLPLWALAESGAGEARDVVFTVSNELSEGKDIAEIHSFRMEEQEGGTIRFTVEYTMPERLYISVFDSPNGDNINLVSNAITVPGKSTFNFELDAAAFSRSETVVLNFYSEDSNRYFVFFSPADNLPAAGGNPVGDPRDVVYQTNNELSEGKDIAEIHSFCMQELDNGFLRFTVEYTMPERLYISVFDPPNGDNFMLVSNTITMPGKSTFTFDLKTEDFLKAGMAVLNFYSEGTSHYLVIIRASDNLAAAETVPAEEEPAAKKEDRAEGNPVGDPKDVVFSTSNELSEGKDIAEIHSFRMQELDNGSLRFTVEYTMPERLYISIFDSPNGDNIHLVSNAITVPGKSVFTFDLDAGAFARSGLVVLNFYGEDTNRFFVFFSPTDNLPG